MRVSRDGGATWDDASEDLLGEAVLGFVFDAAPGTLYAFGAGVGVQRRVD